MGVDLTLMPVLMRGGWLCHEMIEAPRDYDLFDLIRAAHPKEVGEPVHCHLAQDDDGNSTYGERTDTPYGQPLTWLPAGDLYKAFIGFDDRKARAIRSFLLEMGRDWPIVLYWH